MNKKLVVFLAMACLLVAIVYAGDFRIQQPAGTDIFIVDGSGNLDVDGTISEGNTLLSEIYCALAGCDMTGDLELSGDLTAATVTITTALNMSGATISIDADALDEASINFTTACAAGNHLYISGNDLACEVDATGAGDGANFWIDQGDVITINNTYGFIINASDYQINDNTLSTIFVNKTGDSMSGQLTMDAGANITLSTTSFVTKGNSTYLYFDSNDNAILVLGI